MKDEIESKSKIKSLRRRAKIFENQENQQMENVIRNADFSRNSMNYCT